MNQPTKAVLYLADGTLYEGISIGAEGTTYGELCFNTGMTGYQEVFTDPSYAGQILIMTSVHIGNYGVDEAENESRSVQISGLVCRHFSEIFSRSGNGYGLPSFLTDRGLVGIVGLDTRKLVAHIRQHGAMNALITTESTDQDTLAQWLIEKCPNMAGSELATTVSTQTIYSLGDAVNHQYKIAVMDYGVKQNMLRSLMNIGGYLQVFPALTSIDDIASFQPDGVLLSNGPGDPASMPFAVELAKQLVARQIPVFGICLGHQIIAQAFGATTYKMSFGHRGLNHPVKNLESGLCEITSQNHGFAVDHESLKNLPNVRLTHVNLNDQTVEGIRITDRKVFSVQYHPEASPGPHDSHYLFHQFAQMMDQA